MFRKKFRKKTKHKHSQSPNKTQRTNIQNTNIVGEFKHFPKLPIANYNIILPHKIKKIKGNHRCEINFGFVNKKRPSESDDAEGFV